MSKIVCTTPICKNKKIKNLMVSFFPNTIKPNSPSILSKNSKTTTKYMERTDIVLLAL